MRRDRFASLIKWKIREAVFRSIILTLKKFLACAISALNTRLHDEEANGEKMRDAIHVWQSTSMEIFIERDLWT